MDPILDALIRERDPIPDGGSIDLESTHDAASAVMREGRLIAEDPGESTPAGWTRAISSYAIGERLIVIWWPTRTLPRDGGRST